MSGHGCPKGKIRHLTASSAEWQLRLMLDRGVRRRKQVDRPEALNVYRCPDCGFWHVGHSRFGKGGAA